MKKHNQKRLLLIYFCSFLQFFFNAESYSQSKRDLLLGQMMINAENPVTVGAVIDQLKRNPQINLSFNKDILDMSKRIPLKNKHTYSLRHILNVIAKETGTEYMLVGKHIIIKKEEKTSLIQTKNISGYVKDKASGEVLLGVLVTVDGRNDIGTTTNLYGFYSLPVPLGNHEINFSYLGFKQASKIIDVKNDLVITVEMEEDTEELAEVVITDRRIDENVTSVNIGKDQIAAKRIEKIPVVFGETDPIKVIKLLPGVQTTGETSSGFSVRGGNFDQNLILLDEAVVYNPSHLLGLFSTFNNDAINKINFYKGTFPVRYGGRLSSVLDVRMREGNSKKISGKGGVSAISSRLTLESPLGKKGSILLSGRRTYADLVRNLFVSKDKAAALYFYDFNGKATYTIDENNRIIISSYSGRDIFRFGNRNKSNIPSFDWGNLTTTLRWNHLYNSKLFSNVSLIYSNYDYKLGFGFEDFKFTWSSKLKDYTAKIDFDYFLNNKNTLSFGVSSIYHTINPGFVKVNSNELNGQEELPFNYTFEHSTYIGNEQKLSENITLNYGLRLSLFQNVGKGVQYNFDENFVFTDSIVHKRGKIFNHYAGFEPRLSGNYLINEKQSIKFGYSRTLQFIQLATNSISGTPLDVWFPASTNVKPQISNQVSVGYFRNFLSNSYEVSTELYYRKMSNQIDFKDHASLFLNRQLEGELRFGRSRAYGLEVKISKPAGKFNGWISYTYSRAERIFEDISNGETYRSPNDRPHNIAVVGNWDISKRVSLSGNWVYYSGLPFTAPAGRFVIGNTVIPTYTQRNGDRLPDYHRMDLGVTLRSKDRPERKFRTSWVFSVYNLYNRQNANSISFRSSEEDPLETTAFKQSIFPIIPTVTFNFEF